jgi:hypothetical protein
MTNKMKCMLEKSKRGYIAGFEFFVDFIKFIYDGLLLILHIPDLKISEEVFLICLYILNFGFITTLEIFILPEHFLLNVPTPFKLFLAFLTLQFVWLPVALFPIYSAFYECYCVESDK